jgi:hypothetical protein
MTAAMLLISRSAGVLAKPQVQALRCSIPTKVAKKKQFGSFLAARHSLANVFHGPQIAIIDPLAQTPGKSVPSFPQLDTENPSCQLGPEVSTIAFIYFGRLTYTWNRSTLPPWL